MTSLKDANVLEPKLISKIFCNIEDVYNVNAKLYGDLEEKVSNWSETQTIADAFVKVVSISLNFLRIF